MLAWSDPEEAGTKEYRRYHLHESKAQETLKKAVRRAKLTKRVKSHTFRHYAEFRTMPSNQISPLTL
jgi:hypothetical protein